MAFWESQWGTGTRDAAWLLTEDDEMKRGNCEKELRAENERLKAENERLKKKARDLLAREKGMIEETKRRTTEAFRAYCQEQDDKIRRQNRLLKKLRRRNEALEREKECMPLGGGVKIPGLMALYEDEIERQLHQMDELAKRYHDLLVHIEEGKNSGMITAEFTVDQFYFG